MKSNSLKPHTNVRRPAKWNRLHALLATILLAGPCLANADEQAKSSSTAIAESAAAPQESPPTPRQPFVVLAEAGAAKPEGEPHPRSGPGRNGPPVPPQTADKSEEDSRDERHRGGRMEGPDEMAVLDRLLMMPPEELLRMRRAIEQIEAMTPEEREALRGRLNDFRQISPEDRHKMREKWRELSPEERREHVRKMRERRWDNVFKAEESEGDAPKKESDE